MKLKVGDRVTINKQELFTGNNSLSKVQVTYVSPNGEIFEYKTGWKYTKEIITTGGI